MLVDKKLLKVYICGIKIDIYKVKDIFPDLCNQKYKGDKCPFCLVEKIQKRKQIF